MKWIFVIVLVLAANAGAAPANDVHTLAKKQIDVFRGQDYDAMDVAIVHLAAMGASVVPDITLALDDKSAMVRSQSAAVIAKIGPPAKAAVPILTVKLEDADNDVKWNSCRALAAIGAAAASAIPALQKLASAKADAPKSSFKSDFDYNKYVQGTKMASTEAATTIAAIKADQANHPH